MMGIYQQLEEAKRSRVKCISLVTVVQSNPEGKKDLKISKCLISSHSPVFWESMHVHTNDAASTNEKEQTHQKPTQTVTCINVHSQMNRIWSIRILKLYRSSF